MQKIVIREAVIFTALLISLAVLMHPDLLSDPKERFALIEDRGNFLHPFVYTFIVYILLFIIRFVVTKVKTFFTKNKNN